jgi:hypothetical protein
MHFEMPAEGGGVGAPPPREAGGLAVPSSSRGTPTPPMNSFDELGTHYHEAVAGSMLGGSMPGMSGEPRVVGGYLTGVGLPTPPVVHHHHHNKGGSFLDFGGINYRNPMEEYRPLVETQGLNKLEEVDDTSFLCSGGAADFGMDFSWQGLPLLNDLGLQGSGGTHAHQQQQEQQLGGGAQQGGQMHAVALNAVHRQNRLPLGIC